MCAYCNNTRTQPHDLAWETMSRWFTALPRPLKKGQFVRANKIFPDDTWPRMRFVHLYFVKVLGCLIVEAKDQAPIDIVPFSKAIMKGDTPRSVFAVLLRRRLGRHFDSIRLESGHVFAVLTCRIKHVTVNIFYAQEGGGWENLGKTWHPRFGTKGSSSVTMPGAPKTRLRPRRPIKREKNVNCRRAPSRCTACRFRSSSQ
jgi:hypothetical protein